MQRHRRVRGLTALAALCAALAVSAVAPALASGQNVVDDLLQGVGVGGGDATPAAGNPGGGDYQPPLNGANPHGQGTVAIGDLTPSDTVPLSGDPAGGEGADQEEVVVGRSRGEQNADGSYHGHVTILALFGNEVLGVDTGPGDTANGPLEPLQEQLLDEICAGSNDALCLEVLKADSETTSSGSTNSFAVLNAAIGGEEGINAAVATSNGNIEGDSSCQTAHGDDNVADVNVGGDALNVDVLQASSDSQACNNGTSSQTRSSKVIQINGNDVPIPCESETADAEFTPLAPLATAVCNANDTNGAGEPTTQTDPAYGVREALSLFVLEMGGESALLKATTAGAESHAVAPAQANPPTTPTTPGGGAGGQAGEKGGGGADGEGGGADGEGGGADERGPAAEAAGPGTGDLAFTGTDVLVLALIGMGLVMAGLTATRLAGRHRRATV
jgi:hypothetical protein